MSEQQKQSLCPRLIDYLAIVGARSGSVQKASGSNNNQPPVQVSRIISPFRVWAGRGISRERISNCKASGGECC